MADIPDEQDAVGDTQTHRQVLADRTWLASGALTVKKEPEFYPLFLSQSSVLS